MLLLLPFLQSQKHLFFHQFKYQERKMVTFRYARRLASILGSFQTLGRSRLSPYVYPILRHNQTSKHLGWLLRVNHMRLTGFASTLGRWTGLSSFKWRHLTMRTAGILCRAAFGMPPLSQLLSVQGASWVALGIYAIMHHIYRPTHDPTVFGLGWNSKEQSSHAFAGTPKCKVPPNGSYLRKKFYDYDPKNPSPDLEPTSISLLWYNTWMLSRLSTA